MKTFWLSNNVYKNTWYSSDNFNRYLSLISEMFLCVKNHFCHTCIKKAAFWYSSHTCVSICTQKQRMGKEGGKMCICGVSGPEKMHNISFYQRKLFILWHRLICTLDFGMILKPKKTQRGYWGFLPTYMTVPFSRSLIPAVYIPQFFFKAKNPHCD